jgi:hypothetical protein
MQGSNLSLATGARRHPFETLVMGCSVIWDDSSCLVDSVLELDVKGGEKDAFDVSKF